MAFPHTFFDTDLFFHRISNDPKVVAAAGDEFSKTRPSAISAFTILEFKGAYVQKLGLLREKVSRSDSLREASARTENSGGRGVKLMLALLLKYLDVGGFDIRPWEEARRQLLVHIDAEIYASYRSIASSVDKVFDDFQCSRSQEPPLFSNTKWKLQISNCTSDAIPCHVQQFLKQYEAELISLIQAIDSLTDDESSRELKNIKDIAFTIIHSSFYCSSKTCRKIGDLLIGLQSKVGYELLTSNFREHDPMHFPLKYRLRIFPLAALRIK